jgi:hypothetical protein
LWFVACFRLFLFLPTTVTREILFELTVRASTVPTELQLVSISDNQQTTKYINKNKNKNKNQSNEYKNKNNNHNNITVIGIVQQQQTQHTNNNSNQNKLERH